MVYLLATLGGINAPKLETNWTNAARELVDAYGWTAVERAFRKAGTRKGHAESHPLQTIAYARAILENQKKN